MSFLKKIDHIVITSKNPEACIRFYEKLGFKSKNHSTHYELFAGDFKINVHILGQELSPRARNVTTGSADICLEVDCDLEQIKQELEQKGITIEMGIVARSGVRGGMKSIYMRDPDENLVELCSYVE